MNTVILSLEYSYLINNVPALYESNNGLWQTYPDTTSKVIDNLAPMKKAVDRLNTSRGSIQLVEPHLNNQLITMLIRGDDAFIADSRKQLLSCYNQVNYKKIPLKPHEFGRINELFVLKMNEISHLYNVEIIISEYNTNFKMNNAASDTKSIYVLGNQDNITVADTQLRVLIDTVLNQFYLDSIDVPLLLIPLIGGVELFNFNEIVKQLMSNIYLPDLMPELFNSHLMTDTKNLKIWVTAANVYENVMTKKVLADLIDTMTKGLLIQKQVVVASTKMDLMVLFDQAEILNIMFKHGTFVQMPSLGEALAVIDVQGQLMHAVNETVRELNLITAKYYQMDLQPDGVDLSTLVNDNYLLNLVELKKTCLLTCSKHGLSLLGRKEEVRAVLKEISLSLPSESFSVLLRLELNNSQKDFISGKKNGKMMKILNQLGQIPIIKFVPFNETNFIIEIAVNTNMKRFDTLLKSIELVELELPAELQFNIPEVFHKSIIGNGGSIIQSIMKKYNVFIKFSSSVKAQQDSDVIFYSFKRLDNVLIKCPSKNASNIMLVKYEIDQLVQQCCMNSQAIKLMNNTIYHTAEVTMTRSHYLMLINRRFNLKFINNLETENNAFIDFPKSIDDFKGSLVQVAIKASEVKARQCATKLVLVFPNDFEFRVASCPGKFGELISDTNRDFKENIVIPFRLMLGIEVVVNPVPMGAKDGHQVLLSFWGSEGDDHVAMAINDLTFYLNDKGFAITAKQKFVYPLVLVVPVPEAAFEPQVLRSIENVSNSYKKKTNRLPVRQPVPVGFPY